MRSETDAQSCRFIVESIKKHMVDEDVRFGPRRLAAFLDPGLAVCTNKNEWQGSLKFHVKWEGYDKKADMTWEPEENLEYDQNTPAPVKGWTGQCVC